MRSSGELSGAPGKRAWLCNPQVPTVPYRCLQVEFTVVLAPNSAEAHTTTVHNSPPPQCATRPVSSAARAPHAHTRTRDAGPWGIMDYCTRTSRPPAPPTSSRPLPACKPPLPLRFPRSSRTRSAPLRWCRWSTRTGSGSSLCRGCPCARQTASRPSAHGGSDWGRRGKALLVGAGCGGFGPARHVRVARERLAGVTQSIERKGGMVVNW